MISAIVAVDNNWGIGYNGRLLEYIPEDLKQFREITKDSWIVMGRKTWDSLPNKPLSNRANVVITNNPELSDDALFLTLENIVRIMKQQPKINFFIIGGGEIYKRLLPYCSKVYVTKIFKDHDQVDTYFPNLDKASEWTPTINSDINYYEDLSYQFWQYDRI